MNIPKQFVTTLRGLKYTRTATLRLFWFIASLTVLANPVFALGDKLVQIRRTTDGIPHILASDWQGLGRGFGFAQAQDAVCTLAEAFATYEGSRSLYFGENGQPAQPSTFGQPKNVELDVFFRYFLSREKVARFRKAQPENLLEVAGGFAQGYNEYISSARSDPTLRTRHPCLREAWTRSITQDDILRRMLAVGIAAGYTKFIPEIVRASPPTFKAAASNTPNFVKRVTSSLGENVSLGSNMLAFGEATTGGSSSVLLGNPHWFWRGPDRFYQVHLTIPGKLNVAGAAFFGIPMVMIGFNDAVAWSHTVSAARRFGLFELELVPGHPERYRYDGVEHVIKPVPIELGARSADGARKTVHHTLYRSHLGPMIDMRLQSEQPSWTTRKAIAIRDINEDNDRIFATFFFGNQAKSLAEFADIHRRESSIPWAHTIAIGRGDSRVWYADIGPVPNVPDELRQRCTSPQGKIFASLDPTVPFLDGRTSSCAWITDARARLPGMMAWQMQPSEWRTDYVANMNGSYWPTSASNSIAGFPITMGGERNPLPLRTLLGHQLAQELIVQRSRNAAVLDRNLREKALDARTYSALRYKQAVLADICPRGVVEVSVDSLSHKSYSPPKKVDLHKACKVLSAWRGTGNIDDGGALLWDAFWNGVQEIPEVERYTTPFSALDPLNTPNTLNMAEPRIAAALGSAVLWLEQAGIALSDPLGKHLYVGNDKGKVPLFPPVSD